MTRDISGANAQAVKRFNKKEGHEKARTIASERKSPISKALDASKEYHKNDKSMQKKYGSTGKGHFMKDGRWVGKNSQGGHFESGFNGADRS